MPPAALLALVFAASIAIGVGYGRARDDGAGSPRRTPAPPTTPPGRARSSGVFAPPRVPPGQDDMTTPGNFTPTLESWRTYFLMFGPDVPIAISMKWTEIESGGNHCGVGDPNGSRNPPKEYGLAQLNADDPSNHAIATQEELRGSCGIGPGHWQNVVRPITEAERIKNATAALGLMRHCSAIATKFLGGDQVANQGGGGVWSAPDYWRLAKCYHASSAVANLFPIVAKALGRTPSWLEFKEHANTLALAHGFGQPWLDRIWRNADKLASALVQPGAGV